VGIGNDFNHGSSIDGFADASEALNVTVALVQAGFSAEDIQKIWSGNFLSVLRQAEQGAAAP
jgi:membrane dipeptidase